MRSRRSPSFVISHFLCNTPDRLIMRWELRWQRLWEPWVAAQWRVQSLAECAPHSTQHFSASLFLHVGCCVDHWMICLMTISHLTYSDKTPASVTTDTASSSTFPIPDCCRYSTSCTNKEKNTPQIALSISHQRPSWNPIIIPLLSGG